MKEKEKAALAAAVETFDMLPAMFADYVAELIAATVNWLNNKISTYGPGVDEAWDF